MFNINQAKKFLEKVDTCHMVQLIDTLYYNHCYKNWYNCIESKEMVDFLLARESYPFEGKNNYREEPLKPPNIVESKEILSTIPELKLPHNPRC